MGWKSEIHGFVLIKPMGKIPLPWGLSRSLKAFKPTWNLTGGPFTRKIVFQDPPDRFQVKRWEGIVNETYVENPYERMSSRPWGSHWMLKKQSLNSQTDNEGPLARDSP